MAKYSSEENQGVPSFEYSTTSASNPLLFELCRPLADLEGMLLREFSGRSVTMKELFDQHNIGRPYIRRNYTEILLAMEEREIVKTDPQKRRKGTLADHVKISFPGR